MANTNNNNGAAVTYHLPGTLDVFDIINLDPDTNDILLTVDDALVEIDAIIAANDADAAIAAVDANPCPRCGGSGDIGRVTILGHSTCLRCNGTGIDTGVNIGAAIRRVETN